VFTFFHNGNQTQHLFGNLFGVLFGFRFSYYFIIDQYPERLLPTRFINFSSFNFSIFLSMAVVLIPIISAISRLLILGFFATNFNIICWLSTNPSTNPLFSLVTLPKGKTIRKKFSENLKQFLS